MVSRGVAVPDVEAEEPNPSPRAELEVDRSAELENMEGGEQDRLRPSDSPGVNPIPLPEISRSAHPSAEHFSG